MNKEQTQTVEETAVIKPIIPSISLNIGISYTEKPDYIYVCGNIPELGAWNPQKAIRIKRNKGGTYNKTLKLFLGAEFEYKILSERDWLYVEKGEYGEEIRNRFARLADVKNRRITEVKLFNVPNA